MRPFTLIFAICVSMIAHTAIAEARVIVSEFVTSNTIVFDEDGDSSDWIELYNSGSETVNLLGFGLSDDFGDSFKWTFGDYNMKPGEYLLVFASGKDRGSASPYFHTSFGLSENDDGVRLTPADQSYFDEQRMISIPRNLSYALHSTGEFELFRGITPGAANGLPLLMPPQFVTNKSDASHEDFPGGFYKGRVKLKLFHDRNPEGVVIRYTTNGRTPSRSSKKYTGPITIKKTTTVRAIATLNGFEDSPSSGSTYFINFDPKGIPLVHIATEAEHLWNPLTGIFSGTGDTAGAAPNQQRQQRRPIHVEYFNENGEQIFTQGGTIQVIGASSRNEWFRPIKITASTDVDPLNSHFIGPVLKNGVNRQRHYQIRNNNQDAFKSVNPVYQSTPTVGIRNSLMSDIFRPDSDFQQRDDNGGVLLCINGFNYGIGNLSEKRDNSTIEANHPQVDGDDIDLVVVRNASFEDGFTNKLKTSIIYDYYNIGIAEYEEISDSAQGTGSKAGVEDFFDLIDFMNSRNMRNTTHYEYVKSRLDLPTFIAGSVAQIIAGNFDYPNNNISFWRNAPVGAQPGPWFLYNFDFDGTFALYPTFRRHDTLAYTLDESRMIIPLLGNQEFKYAFIRKFDHYLNGLFSYQRTSTLLAESSDKIEPWIRHYIDLYADKTFEYGTWKGNVEWVRKYLRDRPADIRKYVNSYFGLKGWRTVNVNIDTPGTGRVLVDTGLYRYELPETGEYFRNVPMTLVAVNERGYGFQGFQIGNKYITDRVYTFMPNSNTTITAMFEEDPNAPAAELVVNELVNSGDQQLIDEDGEESDWVEIYNTAPYAIDLSGKYLTDNANDPTQWEFPAVTMGPNEFMIVYCSGKDKRDPSGNLHTNFRLSGGNSDPVYIFDSNGVDQIDAMLFQEVEDIPSNHSGGRFPDGSTSFATFSQSTPGAPNIAPPEPAVLDTPTPGSTLNDSDVTFGWTTGNQVERYQLNVGRTASLFQFRNANDFLFSAETSDTSVLATGLPQDGGNLFVRLWSKIGDEWIGGNVITYRTQVAAQSQSESGSLSASSQEQSSSLEESESGINDANLDPLIESIESLPEEIIANEEASEEIKIEPETTSMEQTSQVSPENDQGAQITSESSEIISHPSIITLAKVDTPQLFDLVSTEVASANTDVANELTATQSTVALESSQEETTKINRITISGVQDSSKRDWLSIGADQQWADAESPILITLLANGFMDIKNITSGTINLADLGVGINGANPRRLVEITDDDLILFQPGETKRIYFVEGLRSNKSATIVLPYAMENQPYKVAFYSSNTMTLIENDAQDSPVPMIYARNDLRYSDKVVVFSENESSEFRQGTNEFYTEELSAR